MTEKDPRGKSSNVWFDLPAPTGTSPYRLDLEHIVADEVMQAIARSGKMVFHTVGDTGGVNTTTYQQQVATFMELDFRHGNPDDNNPAFFYHLGDVVYYDGEIKNYFWEFYEPYLHYPGSIFAIPGNHDGDIDPNDEFHSPSDSLKGFVRNFCSQSAMRLPEAQDAPRDAMTQPNVYWTLNTPLATIIGLYTNVPEGGKIGLNQLEWFKSELREAPDNRALILALHHPIYSAYGHHPGSQVLKDVLQEAFSETGRNPDLILTAHVHNYQRFTGTLNGEEITTLVVGAGGYNQRLHALSRRQFDPAHCPYRFDGNTDRLEAFNDFQHGYLLLEVDRQAIRGSYIAVDDPARGDPAVPTKRPDPSDTFEIPLRLR